MRKVFYLIMSLDYVMIGDYLHEGIDTRTRYDTNIDIEWGKSIIMQKLKGKCTIRMI